MVLWSLDGQAFIDHGGSGMGRKNGEGSGSTPRVLKLEEAKKRTLVGVGGKVEQEEEEGQFQSQSFLLHHIHSLQQQQQQPPPLTTPKKQKTATTATGGRHIVAVPGGRNIARPTGCKDRHSKVRTAKGLRDRRVRLSARTAIEFYDVQDRLGYDRPSMAVDWLLRNAKAAIDELPAWQPRADHAAAGGFQEVILTEEPATATNSMNSFGSDGVVVAINDSFQMASSCYPPADLLSRTSSQDLRLSLDSINPNLFSFDTGRETAAGGRGGGGGCLFSLTAPLQQTMIDHRRLILTQRGPLQSSSSTPVPSWMDQTIAPMTSSQISMHPPAFQYPSSSSSSFPDIDQFGPNGVFSGFRMSSWIQGEEQGVEGVSDEPPASRR